MVETANSNLFVYVICSYFEAKNMKKIQDKKDKISKTKKRTRDKDKKSGTETEVPLKPSPEKTCVNVSNI